MKKNIFSLSIFFLFLSFSVEAQEIIPKTIYAEFDMLIYDKRQYEKYSALAERSDKWINNRDSLYNRYIFKIETMQGNPGKYIEHLNYVIETNDKDSENRFSLPYDYFDTLLPFDPSVHFVSRVELYKIIKKHIFEKKEKMLPHRLEVYDQKCN